MFSRAYQARGTPGFRQKLQFSVTRPDSPYTMVNFQNPNRPDHEAVSVWCDADASGFRLHQRHPDGDVHTDRCPDRAALYAATARLQADLLASGWRPLARVGAFGNRSRSRRSGQFHR